MDSLSQLFWHGGKFLGIDWHLWKIIGWLGNAAFFSRFMVQWYATEKQKRVVIPIGFWWLSLAGSGLLFAYALFYRKDSVFIFTYAFTWIPYVRNLLIHHRTAADGICPACSARCPAGSNFCQQCGKPLPGPTAQPSSKE